MNLGYDIGVGIGWMHLHGGLITATGVALDAGNVPKSLQSVIEDWWADNACDYCEAALAEQRRAAGDRRTHAKRDGDAA